MRRRPVRKIEIHFIDVAPAPPFRRIIAFDDRVLGHVKMLGRVPIWRLVAAANMPTAAADTQRQPRGAQFQASYPGAAWNNFADPSNMFAMHCHAPA